VLLGLQVRGATGGVGCLWVLTQAVLTSATSELYLFVRQRIERARSATWFFGSRRRRAFHQGHQAAMRAINVAAAQMGPIQPAEGRDVRRQAHAGPDGWSQVQRRWP